MPSPLPITSKQVANLRLLTLGLHDPTDAPRCASPREVVAHHLAMQGQDWASSRWAIGSRLGGATDADVLAAFDAGEIVRSWPMRGTVHVTLAEDIGWLLEHLGVRALATVPRRWEQLGLDEPTMDLARDTATTLLRGDGSATRAALSEAFVDAGIELGGQRAYHIIWYLAQTGTLVQGPIGDGGEQLFVLLDEWVTTPRRLDRDAALAEVARRWLGARGPAQLDDLVHWTKLTKGDCRRALEAIADDVVQLDRAGVPYLMLRDDWERFEGVTVPATAVQAVAAFDEHLLGYRWRDDVLDPDHFDAVVPGGNGMFASTIVRGGRLVATWKRTRLTHHTRVEVLPFESLPARSTSAIGAALERWGAFTGTQVDVVDRGKRSG